MSRRLGIVLIAGVAALFVIAAVILGALYVSGWDGARANRLLGPGDSVSTLSGLTVTVPAGFQGAYSTYYDLPSWLPLGESASGLHRADMLQLSRLDHSCAVMAVTYYGTGRVPRTGGLVTSSPDAAVYASAPDPAADLSQPHSRAVVVTSLPGRSKGYVSIWRRSSDAPLALSRSVWALLRANGVSLP
jgi:hypothetical protein